MALSQEQIFALELDVRRHADDLRKRVAAQPGTSAAMKLVDEFRMAEAKRFDMIGDLLQGMRGLDEQEFVGVMEMLRTGFKRMGRKYDESKTYTLAFEAGATVEAEAAEPTEVAA
jgi:hypothetical protein